MNTHQWSCSLQGLVPCSSPPPSATSSGMSPPTTHASPSSSEGTGEPILFPAHVPQEVLIEKVPASHSGVILTALQPSPPSPTARGWQVAFGAKSMRGICPES